MVYVQRDDQGAIVGLYANLQDGCAEEKLEDDNVEVLAFQNPIGIIDYENAIQNLVDRTARDKQFRDGVTLASYTASTKPKWAAEAQAFVAWRDNVWSYSYHQLEQVQSGAIPQPSVEEFLQQIARIAWPS